MTSVDSQRFRYGTIPMWIPILLPPNPDERPRPIGRPPLTVDGLGATRKEALARLREAIARRTAEGESDWRDRPERDRPGPVPDDDKFP
jgi:hypothetical protein